ncbi:twin-arginine translocation signal domain-containing protein [Calditerrivibrio sp.]|uniref:twin-arginine translocation signal domain-containing protein n=1 Tax=Calditerrivibrio sp. TaxID=2792612 RepID=UPI003D0CA9FD
MKRRDFLKFSAAVGHFSHQLDIRNYVDNTDLFKYMTKFFKINYKNPQMTAEEARSFLKSVSMKEWQEHLRLHIS